MQPQAEAWGETLARTLQVTVIAVKKAVEIHFALRSRAYINRVNWAKHLSHEPAAPEPALDEKSIQETLPVGDTSSRQEQLFASDRYQRIRHVCRAVCRLRCRRCHSF